MKKFDWLESKRRKTVSYLARQTHKIITFWHWVSYLYWIGVLVSALAAPALNAFGIDIDALYLLRGGGMQIFAGISGLGFIHSWASKIRQESISIVAENLKTQLFSDLTDLPTKFLETNADLVYRKLILSKGVPVAIKDEILFYLMIEKYLERNIADIKSFQILLSCHDSGFTMEFLKRIQEIQLRLSDLNSKVEKRFRVLDSTEYDQENFFLDAEGVQLMWLHQIEYSKSFFYEGLHENNISVFIYHPSRKEHPRKYPFFDASQTPDTKKINMLNEYYAKDVVLIETERECFLSEVKRDPSNFSFQGADTTVSSKGAANPMADKVGAVKVLFKSLAEISAAHWKAEKNEGALLSAENIKLTTTYGDRIFASDPYDGRESLSSWISPTKSKWIVWRACQAAVGKRIRHGEYPEITIERLFVIDDEVLKSPDKLSDFMAVLAMQFFLGIKVKIALKKDYNDWVQRLPSNFTDKFHNEFAFEIDVVPDLSYVLRGNDVYRGINFTSYPKRPFQGPIFPGDNKWKELSDLLWGLKVSNIEPLKSVEPKDSPNIGAYSGIASLEIGDRLRQLSELDQGINLPRIKDEFDEHFSVVRDESYMGQYLFWERFWSLDSSLMSSGNSEKIIESMDDISEDQMILEIGCGDGRNTQYLVTRDCNICIVEQSIYACMKFEENMKKLCPERKFIVEMGYAHETTFSGNTFDKVICIDVFNHTLDWKPLIDEFYRVLKPNGVLIANALSSNDHSYQELSEDRECTRTGNLKFTKKFPSGGQARWPRKAVLIMGFSTEQSIRSDLEERFQIESVAEYTRIDQGHIAPFNPSTHEHCFWEIRARKKQT